MHKVYSIVKKRYSKKYFVNFVDFSHNSLELSIDILTKYGISKGVEIGEDLLTKAIGEQTEKDAKQAGYNFVSYKPRSESEVRNKLATKGFSQGNIDSAIKFLYEFNLLDDEKYAKSFIESYLSRKPAGTNKLEVELKRKGIDKSIIQKALLKHYPQNSSYELALTAMLKHRKKLTHKPIEKQKKLISDFLARRGFDWDIIKKVLETIE